MRSSILAVALILMLVASVATIKQAAANSTHIATSTLAEREEDDTLYLRRFTKENLTTAAPDATTAATITVGANSFVILKWVNGTESGGWQISSGTYTFYCFMEKSTGTGDVDVTVTFKFGYIKKDGTIVTPITGSSPIKNIGGAIREYSISVTTGSTVDIPSGSKLFINVTISTSSTGTAGVIFYYDGVNQKTRIITPSIRIAPAVPEFPLGVVFVPPTLLLAYFILKKRFMRFNL